MLIDKYLSHYNYHEHHHTTVKAHAKDCFLTAKELDMPLMDYKDTDEVAGASQQMI